MNYLTLILAGVQDCVNIVSPLEVTNSENCLTVSSQPLSSTTLLIDNALLAATSLSTASLLFLGTLSTTPPCDDDFSSFALPPPFSADDL